MINKNKKFTMFSIINIFTYLLLYLTIQRYETNGQLKIKNFYFILLNNYPGILFLVKFYQHYFLILLYHFLCFFDCSL